MQNLTQIPLDDLLLLGKKLKQLDLSQNQLTSIPGSSPIYLNF